MINRVQYLSGGEWQLLGDYVTPARAVAVAKEFEKVNPGTRTRVISSVFVKPIAKKSKR